MRKLLILLIVGLIILFVAFLTRVKQTTPNIRTFQGILRESKGGTGVIGDGEVFIPDMNPNDLEKHLDKKVEVTGEVMTAQGLPPGPQSGAISQGFQGERLEMRKVISIKVIE